MGWLNTYTRPVARVLGTTQATGDGEMSYRQACEMLEAYYLNNDLYRHVSLALREQGLWGPAMKELRNPTYCVVEFYVMTVWPGQLPDALPIESENERIIEPIHRLWRWSNWSSQKQVLVRQLAQCGDAFIRIGTKTDEAGQITRVYLHVLKSKHVTDYRVDERGNVTYLRIDVPEIRQDGSVKRNVVHTQVYEPEQVRVWEHDRDVNQSVAQLGNPKETRRMAALGINFVPIVRVPFQDIGDTWGLPAIWTSLSQIDEVNKKATRLSQLMFRHNKNTWALRANATDAQGRPLPAPTLNMRGTSIGETDDTALKDEEIYRLPGNSSLESLVPNIQWQAHLDAIMADLEELRRKLPELRYFDVVQGGNTSGRALQYMLAPAINRALEVRGNAEAGLAKAHAMALTIAQEARLEGFTSIGNFDDNDFEHHFAERDVLPVAVGERLETAKTATELGVPAQVALRKYCGWTDQELEDLAPPTASPEVQAQQAQAAKDQAEAQVNAVLPEVLKAVGDAAVDYLIKNKLQTQA